MHLKNIKLAGFKSFVDPITIPITGNLIGIVGPNGCGKSNIIDAIRWVMGESSAKLLRGDSMADVIFNGSTVRKPVGRASVELQFDNSDGSVSGQYAGFAELSIRRETSRDGGSDYFINKTRCRRKDITDFFLGTGLGPRAYSIIEQDMVSRIVEAKPEELRAFFEEAAGISKYKERRRETESRIRHTRENLSRVEDIRSELATQLRRLRRQSNAANRYREAKQEERLAHTQWLALRWRALDAQVQEADRGIASQENALESAIADQRGIEAKIEKFRTEQTEASDHFNTVQGEFYSVGAEIASREQGIQHVRDTHNQRVRELEQVSQSWNESSQHLHSDVEKLKKLNESSEQIAPKLEKYQQQKTKADEVLQAAEQAMGEWQADWDTFAEAAAESAKGREIQQARGQHLEAHMTRLQERQARLTQEADELDAALKGVDLDTLQRKADELAHTFESLENRLAASETRMKEVQTRDAELATQLEDLRGGQHKYEARLVSLRELQAAAEGKHDAALNEWLSEQGLEKAPRLVGSLSVEPGWERAVERVLGAKLAAVCVDGLEDVIGHLQDDVRMGLSLVDLSVKPNGASEHGRPTLLDKTKADADLGPLLASTYISETLNEALEFRASLAPHESIITRSAVWVGPNWLSLAGEEDARAGMLAREREIKQLVAEANAQAERLDKVASERSQLQREYEDLERGRMQYRQRINQHVQERTAFQQEHAHEQARATQHQARIEQIAREQEEIGKESERGSTDLDASKALLREAEGESGTHDQRRHELLQMRDRLRAQLDDARKGASETQDVLHVLEVERQGMRVSLDSTHQSVTRLESQLKHLAMRREELEQMAASNEDPEAELKKKLDGFLAKRLEVEGRLQEARKAITDLDAVLREREQARSQQEQQVQELRQIHEEARVSRQELLARRDGLGEQVSESGFELAETLEGLPDGATEDAWQVRIDELRAKIERLGPVNLAAAEEHKEHSERKQYLDKQSNDLFEALTTLEDAIRKMDRESRTRFKETFDKVNAGFQSFFPRLFGGGSASLELTDTDLLNTGVTVMARPPGKRNSTIHLLSGGEKALTAVALLFSLFELNPAPFCLLDEVDAPLDDTNVERYCETVKKLSEKTQLLYVTHNKISMETAKVLVGVTMTEPGVSRLVAVDVDEALELAAQ